MNKHRFEIIDRSNHMYYVFRCWQCDEKYMIAKSVMKAALTTPGAKIFLHVEQKMGLRPCKWRPRVYGWQAAMAMHPDELMTGDYRLNQIGTVSVWDARHQKWVFAQNLIPEEVRLQLPSRVQLRGHSDFPCHRPRCYCKMIPGPHCKGGHDMRLIKERI